jgi:kynurenine formamidase
MNELDYSALPPVGEPVGSLGPYRTVRLSRVIDPATEKRRCDLRRHVTEVQGVNDYHTDVDLVTHLGTHVEAPFHHAGLTRDVAALPASHFAARGVLLKLQTGEAELITAADLDAADGGRVRAGDAVVLDSRYHAEPFAAVPGDPRPHLSREAAEWLVARGAKAVGFGDGICIETNIEHCIACHDILLERDILFIEVMENLPLLNDDVFLMVYAPLPIRGLDSSPVNVLAIEGIPGFRPE